MDINTQKNNTYNNQKFYWIKLKTDFFNQDSIDFLMSQKNGSDYVVLYQMLCLQTSNFNGQLASTIGEVIIPYDVEKIQRDCKYFDIDTIRVALELYKKLGLVYMQDDGILRITNFENMVGSITQNAIYKQNKKTKNHNELEFFQQDSNRIPIRD